ncbi:NADP-dependent oxidoreductase [Haloferacaceae archaeon DSL9]
MTMRPDTNRRWLLANRPTGTPDSETFELVESDVPSPETDEVLVRTRYLSVDPYMRGRMRDAESYAEPWTVGDPLTAAVVGEVADSGRGDFAEGDLVVGELDWADYTVAAGSELTPLDLDPDVAPASAALGVLGMPGRTAYFGMLEVAQPRPGDTVVVSGAAGAVGSVAGQLAREAGCRVIGVAGSDEKTAWLTDDLGFDGAINYEADDVPSALDDRAPDGVDVYFDNVGGPITDAVFDRLNLDARVAICGQIDQYNATEQPTGPRKLWKLIETRARVEGFLVSDFQPHFEEATERLAGWVADGTLRYEETVTEGLENAPDAFLGLFEGENIGKQVVKVAEAGE